ncbi:MAG TPA: CDP-diacylglycerol--serine O-phosphatidyltransferase [Gammaproteobacteria bacterium]|nr:CDP-diacylglycerol--serine O-phosphatidyltransferase [Gammaproteobacteria bacterium]
MVRRRRGIYLLPNLFTTAALFAGFYSIVAAMNARFESAAVAIFVAMILDGMDGRIARMTNTQSDFGVQYDSLSDMVSFGIAPALVVYQWSLATLGKLGWLGAFIFAAATALRLARFNTQAASADKRFFQGLPCPAGAAVIASMIWLVESREVIGGSDILAFTFPLTILVGILMVSNVRYHSFKQIDLRGRVPFVAVLIVVCIFVFIASEPPLVLFLLSMVYAVSGPVMTLVMVRKHRAARKSQESPGK